MPLSRDPPSDLRGITRYSMASDTPSFLLCIILFYVIHIEREVDSDVYTFYAAIYSLPSYRNKGNLCFWFFLPLLCRERAPHLVFLWFLHNECP